MLGARLGDVGVGDAGDAALGAELAFFPNLKYAKTHNPTHRMAPIWPVKVINPTPMNAPANPSSRFDMIHVGKKASVLEEV